MCDPIMICRMLLRSAVSKARSLALPNAGRMRPARIAMMAITTRSSIRVNAAARVKSRGFILCAEDNERQLSVNRGATKELLRRSRKSGARRVITFKLKRHPSPRNPVIFAVVAGAAPEGAVLLIEVDGRDGDRCLLREIELVTHTRQLASNP